MEGDRGANGMAQPFHHSILPLASAADQLTEVRWGIRDFEVRFGRRPTGMWLPETAVDQATLRVLVDHGITHVVLAPWQVVGADGQELDTRRPVRVDLGDGRSIVAVLYDGLLSAAVSFDPTATVDADWFVRDRLWPRLHQEPLPGEAPPLVVIATDGELYGHHQPLRDHFLARLVGRAAPPDLPYATPTLSGAVERAAASDLPIGRLRDRTSWSCHHGVARWGASCDCVPDGAWKGPLRAALDRLAGGVDAATEQLLRALPGQPDAWAARDASVEVLLGLETTTTFADRWLAPAARTGDRATFAAVDGGAALATRDVRQLRLVLGRAGPHRDRWSASVGGARRAPRRWPCGHGPRADGWWRTWRSCPRTGSGSSTRRSRLWARSAGAGPPETATSAESRTIDQ